MKLRRLGTLLWIILCGGCEQAITIAEQLPGFSFTARDKGSVPENADAGVTDPRLPATHFASITTNGTTLTTLGDDYSECERTRESAGDAFTLTAYIQDSNDRGVLISYKNFLGARKASFPLAAGNYEDTVDGTGTLDSHTLRIQTADGTLETSEAEAGFRSRASHCVNSFTLSADGFLKARFECARLYDTNDRVNDVTISLECPLQDVNELGISARAEIVGGIQ